jgi:hypothetical protein
VKEPAKKNMYKSISAAYTVIVLSYWQLALCGYWDFGSQVQPYILASLSIPEWTVVMANLFAAIQICGCFQVESLSLQYYSIYVYVLNFLWPLLLWNARDMYSFMFYLLITIYKVLSLFLFGMTYSFY